MKKQLFIAVAGAAVFITYFLLRKKYADPDKYLHFESTRVPQKSHHLTNAFAKAKKHALN